MEGSRKAALLWGNKVNGSQVQHDSEEQNTIDPQV